MRMIVDDRDRTFVFLLSAREEAEAERDRLQGGADDFARVWQLAAVGAATDPRNFTWEAIAREALKGPEE